MDILEKYLTLSSEGLQWELGQSQYYKIISEMQKKIHAQIPSQSFNTARVAAPTDIRTEVFNGINYNRAVIYLMSNGCEWALKSAHGCTMCGHLGRQTRRENTIEADDFIKQFSEEFARIDFEKNPLLNVYNNGSFLNDREIPPSARKAILEMVNADPHIKMLVIETRPEFVTEQKVVEIKRLIPEKHVEVAIGLELKNDLYRQLCLNKGFSARKFEEAARIINRDLHLRTYAFLKPPILSEKESIGEAIETVEYAFDQGSATVSLEACTIQDYTLVDYLFKRGLYTPPWLWSIVEVIRRSQAKGKLIVGLFQFYPSPNIVPYNCSRCSERLLSALRVYNRTLDKRALGNLVCSCKEEWEKLKRESIPFDRRLEGIIKELEPEIGTMVTVPEAGMFRKKTPHYQKILLGLAPFWSPLIPPMGIASLKAFLQPHGYSVKTVDLNVEPQFKEIYSRYFEMLTKYIPEEKRGNLHNIGHDVLQNHMMAHMNHRDERRYVELVRLLIYQIFFVDVGEAQVREINGIFYQFFSRLESYIEELIAAENPEVVGLTAYCGNLPASMFIFKLVKEKFPHIKTVMGGGVFSQQLGLNSPNFKYFLEKTPYIDSIIIGEGQKLFLKYLQGELPESKRIYTLRDINRETLDLSVMRLPDLSDYDLPVYPYLSAQSSRSCPNNCSFCNSKVFWGDYVKRDPRVAAQEMMALYEQHGIQLFYMSDSLLNPTITDLSHELIKFDTSVYFDAYLRVHQEDCDCVGDIDNTMLWRRAGFYRARMGCETGSQRLLDMVDKKVTVEQIKTAVSALAQAGIKTTTYWVVGLPGETEEDFQQTLRLLEELKNDIYQAECAAFIYYYNGQNKSDAWAAKRKLLFPSWAKEMLVTQTWILDCDPRRPVIYERLNRFKRHLTELGIPNPFTLGEINKADERWKRLHKNAVPSILEFNNRYIDENKSVRKMFFIPKKRYDEGDFGFAALGNYI